jgi:hypothetical protein
MQHFVLDESILIHLRNVLSRVELVLAGLTYWHDQTPAQAAAKQHGENAEVENHSSLGVHVFD